jgi:hypothetical protein
MKIAGLTVEFCCGEFRDCCLIGDISLRKTNYHRMEDGRPEWVMKSVVVRPEGNSTFRSEMFFDFCPFCGTKIDEGA